MIPMEELESFFINPQKPTKTFWAEKDLLHEVKKELKAFYRDT